MHGNWPHGGERHRARGTLVDTETPDEDYTPKRGEGKKLEQIEEKR